MKRIKPTPNKYQWPRTETKTIECRKRDLVFRIADWRRDRDEPGYDVETYIGGVYDWNESKVVTTKSEAIAFVQAQVQKLL